MVFNKFSFSFLFLLFLSDFLFASNAFIDDKFVSIQTLLDQKMIEVEVQSLGGHEGECIVFNIKNLQNKPLKVLIESGRRLLSNDTMIQDILIVKKEEFILASKQLIHKLGTGFCCQSNNHSPKSKDVFDVGRMAPPSWIELANVIDQNNFPLDAVQSAVWAISNNHEISSIYDENMESIRLLRETVAKIKGEELPWYRLKYRKDNSRLFTHEPMEISGSFDYYIKNNTTLSASVLQDGKMLVSLVKNEPVGTGQHQYTFNLRIENWPEGKYSFCLIDGAGSLVATKDFVLR